MNKYKLEEKIKGITTNMRVLSTDLRIFYLCNTGSSCLYAY